MASPKPWTRRKNSTAWPDYAPSCRERTDLPLDEIQKTVLESVENFARGARQADDVTILVVRFRTVATGVTEAGISADKPAAVND